MSSLSALLRMPEVANDVLRRQQIADDLQRDIFDGTYCLNDPVLSDPAALKIVTYDDEFTIVNPIGHHTKSHKILAFYFMLCNIRPEYRSRLQAIQLIALARSVDIKRCPGAIDKLLADFICSMNALRKGLRFEIEGSTRYFHGGLIAHAGDTLASQNIGGFNEGVAKAISPCRTCNIQRDALKLILVSEDLQMRKVQKFINPIYCFGDHLNSITQRISQRAIKLEQKLFKVFSR
jgi:hypothetical protein